MEPKESKSKSCVAGGFVCRARKWAVKLRGEWGGSFFGRTLGVFEWGCAAGTLKPLAYTRASSSEFYYPILHKFPPILESLFSRNY